MYINLWHVFLALLLIYTSGATSLLLFLACSVGGMETKRKYLMIPFLWPLFPAILLVSWLTERAERDDKRKTRDILDGTFPVDDLFPNVKGYSKPEQPD